MSTAYSSAKQQYIGNGATTEWGFDFPIQKHSELKVYLRRSGQSQVLLEEGVDYSFVTENTIAFPIKTGEAKLQAADVLALQRESVFESEYNFSNQQRLEPEEVMNSDDNLERQIQELKRDSESAIKVLPTSNVDPNTFFEHVERVYGSVDNIDTVANDKANVDAVAGNITNVNTVGGSIESVKTVANNIESVVIDATNISDIKTVAGSIANVNKTAGSIDNVNVVAPSIASVNTVSQKVDDVTTVATNIVGVNTVADSVANVNRVGNSITNVNTVSGIADEVDQVAMIADQTRNVGDNISDVMTVASVSEQVKTVSANAASVKAIGDNIDTVLQSPENARKANIWAEGNDSQVESLGGTHSAKVWASIAASVAKIDSASETSQGIARIATADEAIDGTNDLTIVTPLKAKYIAEKYAGKVVQLGFNGVLENNVLTFNPDQDPYEINAGYEYEIDLLFPAAGVLPDSTQMVIKNGTDTVQIVNVRHADASTPITYGDMKQICRYDAEIGWRWVFNARFAVTDTGVKVLVMPSYAFQDDRYVTTDTNQNINAGKNFINNATSTTPDAHTGMSLCLKNEDAELGANTQNADGTVNFKYQGIRVVDKNNEEISSLYSAPDGVGGSFTRMSASAKVDDQYVDGFVELEVDANGKTHFYVPEVDEDVTVNGTQAATVNYVKKSVSGLELMDVVFASLGIDESKNKRRYLNGQVIIQSQFPAFTSAVKARMSTMANAFTTETNWQAEKTNSKLGQCGKFVVDDTAGTIRLPCVVNAQGLVDLALIGGIKSESLPDAKFYDNTYWASVSDASGSLVSSKNGGIEQNTTAKKTIGGASIQTVGYNSYGTLAYSSSTYQDNAPVQQEAVQYPYCIVVNTDVEEADRPINNYQVNNVYSYGMSQYYKGTMNNNSWLKSAGQWNYGTVYTGMYNWLLEQMNAGVSGFVASTATYTDYDFVINTEDQTFRLPLKNGREGVFADGVKGNGMTIVLTDGTKNVGLSGTLGNSPDSFVGTVGRNYGTDVGTISTGGWSNAGVENSLGLTTDPSKSGMIVDKTVPSGWNLYYYIGDTLQNAQLINVARIEEKLSDVNAASRGYVVDSYHNGSEWYRIYSDGWCEQGGRFYNNANTVNTISFLKPFKNTDYSLLINHGVSGGFASAIQGQNADEAYEYTTTSFKAVTNTGNGLNWIVWSARGYYF